MVLLQAYPERQVTGAKPIKIMSSNRTELNTMGVFLLYLFYATVFNSFQHWKICAKFLLLGIYFRRSSSNLMVC